MIWEKVIFAFNTYFHVPRVKDNATDQWFDETNMRPIQINPEGASNNFIKNILYDLLLKTTLSL